MVEITTEQIKKLRDDTGISVMQCKKALEEAEGDYDKARIILEKKSKAVADKKSDRELGAGVVASYIHSNGTIGSMVEILCETDFVSNNEEFKKFAYEIAMHIAASNPQFLAKSDITPADTQKAEEVFKEEVKDKPAEMQAKILEGKLNAYFKDKVLLEQEYIKNPEKTIQDLLNEVTQKFGEKTVIGRFCRFAI